MHASQLWRRPENILENNIKLLRQFAVTHARNVRICVWDAITAGHICCCHFRSRWLGNNIIMMDECSAMNILLDFFFYSFTSVPYSYSYSCMLFAALSECVWVWIMWIIAALRAFGLIPTPKVGSVRPKYATPNWSDVYDLGLTRKCAFHSLRIKWLPLLAIIARTRTTIYHNILYSYEMICRINLILSFRYIQSHINLCVLIH